MKYLPIREAVGQAKNVKTEDVIKAICEYVGSEEESVRRVMAPLIKLWEMEDAAGKPAFGIWRNLDTSQFENYIVMKIAEREKAIPVYFTYIADVFISNNSEKNVFEKNKLFYGQGINMTTIHLCYNTKTIEGRSLSRIVTQSGLTLAEYHLRMRKRVGLCKENIIDLGDIFRNLLNISKDKMRFSHEDGRAKKEWYYPLWMMIASKLVIFEDFEVCKSEMKELVEHSYEKAASCGLNPNFVLLKANKTVDWYMTKPEKEGGVSDSVKKMIDEIK